MAEQYVETRDPQASLVIAITIPATTKTMIATCIQNQNRGIDWRTLATVGARGRVIAVDTTVVRALRPLGDGSHKSADAWWLE